MVSWTWLLWYMQAKRLKLCMSVLVKEKIVQLPALWSNLSVQIKELNKPSPRGGERKTDKAKGQQGSSISLCAGRETARAVWGRHNQTKTQIENRQGQEDTETGEWVHWLLLLCNAVATSHHCRLQSSQRTEPHLATVAAGNELAPLPSAVNYEDMAHHGVSVQMTTAANTPWHGLVADTIRRQCGGWRGCKDKCKVE